MTTKLWGVAAAALIFTAPFAKADEWVKTKESDDGPANAKGNVEYREEEKAGVKFVVIKVNVTTRVKGYGKTGRGHAIYTIFDKDGKPYKIIDSRKYCSTGTKKEKEEDHSTEVRILKDSFFNNLDSDMLVVFAEDKGGVPNTGGDWAKWIKEVAGPELMKVRDEVAKAAKGTIKEGGNWIIQKRK